MFTISRLRLRQCGTALAVVMVLSACAGAQAVAQERTYEFNIPAEDTAKALNDFSRQTGIQILFPYDLVAGHPAPAVNGKFTPDEVLSKLLEGSGLEIAARSERSITLRPATSGSGTRSDTAGTTEVIVTGTHIRGGNPTSPVHTVTRKDIERSGYSQIGDIMRSLPENFAGGHNPGVMAADPGSTGVNSNYSGGSSMDLRGLGADATLTLVNGHRLAGDAIYQSADISGIPLAAVQRIEVVTDGSSALYGSDAVAGVVNVILRKDFDGGEASFRAGSSTGGGADEQTVSLLNGITRGNWHFLANAEYSQQDPLYARDRAYTSGVVPGDTLLRGSQRRSLFLNAGHDGEHVSVTIDALVGDLRTQEVQQQTLAARQNFNYTWTPSYSVAASMETELAGDWKLHAYAAASGGRNVLWTRATNYYTQNQYKNAVRTIEATLDGTLIILPSGSVKAAFGLGQRDEEYHSGLPGGSFFYDADRTVKYSYAEILAPLVSPSPTRTGLHELELSLSGRSENYSDLGTAAVPKIGLRYVPFNGLTVRGTWGRSYKAPSFSQKYGPEQVYLFPASSLGGTGGGTAFLTFGSNRDLKPERSSSWTLGADYRPQAMPSMTLSATRFNIDYTDRVVTAVPLFTKGLSDPINTPFIVNNPTAAEQAALIAGAAIYVNVSGQVYDPANVVAIVQDHNVNATYQQITGTDLSWTQTFNLPRGSLWASVNVTSLTLRQQTIPTVPVTTLSGTIFNVPDQKIRAGLAYDEGRFSISGFINYVSKEIDTGVTPVAAVGAFTTADLSMSWRLSGEGRTGTRVNLAVSNLFDADPPYAVTPSKTLPGFYYDSTNSSPLGRFVSVSVAKGW